MADHPLTKDNVRSRAEAADLLLARAVHRAQWALMWERLWPPFGALATVAGFFVAFSWLGLWQTLPAWGRLAGLAVFAALAIWALSPLFFVRWPRRAEALQRIDRGSGLSHRPATAIADELANSDDQVAVALWRAHLDRVIDAAHNLKAGLPHPRLAWRDPYALRALALFLVVATFFAAGGDRITRIKAAFDWQAVASPANSRIDAWVTPPSYTARPPVVLPGLRPGEQARPQGPVAVPAGSVVLVRATGTGKLDIVASGGLVPDQAEQAGPATGIQEQRFVVQNAGEARLRGFGPDVVWAFTAIPDAAPVIGFLKEPEIQGRGAVQLTYRVEDDYGVVEARALLAHKEAATGNKVPRPLYGPPDFPLTLPQARTRSGAGQTIKDLADHPWAGSDVVITLLARDEAGNEGRSDPVEFRLPERNFTKPLAQALAEQRRNLALDADTREQVLVALDALTIAPDRFGVGAGIYLGLRSIFWQLTRSRSDDALRDVVTRLWQMANAIEDDNLSDVEAALRAAQEALRQALERGASDEEIKKLTEDLRAALDKFMQSLAEQLRNNPQQNARRMDPNMRNIRPQDLKNMIDRMEQMARSGARDAAKRMLDELQSILENLQTAQPGQPQDGDDDDMMSSLNELNDMIQKQQQLRDRTFREGQEQRRERQRGERRQGQQGQQSMGELRQNQQALREQLKKLLEELRKRGMAQGDQGSQRGDQLGRADESMGDAEGQLGEGNPDSAVESQGRALEALRQGAQNLAQMMQDQGMMPGPGGPNGQPNPRGQRRADQGTDPLGRPLRHGRDVDDPSLRVPGEIDVQRARRILEELRRRFGETDRPQIELDYIERLLRGF
ncbi:MAG: TIGR02302 family protein [Pseudorhodoplanes sp.]